MRIHPIKIPADCSKPNATTGFRWMEAAEGGYALEWGKRSRL
jgi:hypothetical protein